MLHSLWKTQPGGDCASDPESQSDTGSFRGITREHAHGPVHTTRVCALFLENSNNNLGPFMGWKGLVRERTMRSRLGGKDVREVEAGLPGGL